MKKLGVYDSGLGGLSLIKHLQAHPIFDEIYYFSDYPRLPYGGQSKEQLLVVSSEITECLLLQKVDAILVACNTATVNTIEELRAKFDVPFIGIEPYVNSLSRESVLSGNSRIGLLMTPATAKSDRFQWLKQEYDKEDVILPIAHDEMATLIEQYLRQESGTLIEIKNEIKKLKQYKLDALILGCTHYPLVVEEFKQILNIPILDPSEYVINQLRRVMKLEEAKQGPSPSMFYKESISDEWSKNQLQRYIKKL